MKRDDPLIDRIAQADPTRGSLLGGAEQRELADRVRQRVVQAAAPPDESDDGAPSRSAGADAKRWPLLPRFSTVVVVASLIVSLVVLTGAVVLLGRGHHGSAVKPAAGGNPAVVRRVIADYAIFRRRPTAADRALPHKVIPERTLLLRHLTTTDGLPVFVALTMYHSHLTGWLITKEGVGAGQGDFNPFPLRKDFPPMVEVGPGIRPGARRWLAFVPDSVTRVVWNSYTGKVVTTRPHDNVVYGPVPAYAYGATFYAGSRQLIQEAVPVGESRLTAPPGTSNAIGEASISMSTGDGTQVDIFADHVLGPRRRFGLWLYSDPSHQHFLGIRIGTAIRPHHTLYGNAQLPGNYRSYRHLLITLQTDSKPTAPGKIVLQGKIPQ
jgi:hypothetical protein